MARALSPGAARAWFTRRPVPQAVLFTVALVGLAFVVLYPLVLLLVRSFDVGPFGQETIRGLENWRDAFTSPQMRSAVWNTITISATHVGISLAIALCVAWLLARTNLPGRGLLEFGFWIAFFLPTLTVTLGWILVFDGYNGLANRWLDGIPFLSWLDFDIYSWWGIVFAHLMTSAIAIKVMLLTPLLRNIDGSLEEASLAAGASRWRTTRRIVVPVMATGVFVIVLLSLIRAIEAFEIELILGAPQNIQTYSTLIYRNAQQSPPEYGTGTALAMIVLFLLVPVILLQQVYARRRSTATMTGKFTRRVHDLGKLRWPAFAFVAGLVMLLAVVPTLLVLMGSAMTRFGFFDVPRPWTLEHWRDALDSRSLVNALKNTLVIGIAAAVISMVVFSIVAYLSVRTRFRGRGLLDFLTWLPTALSGIIMSLGFLWLFLSNPVLRALYGTIWVLVLAVVLSGITLGTQVIKTNLLQIGGELEEASMVTGASWLRTFVKVVLPPIAPAVAVVGVLVFTTAARSTAVISLLTVKSTEPLSMVQLYEMADGSLELAAIVGVFILVLTVGVGIVARTLGMRSLGLER